METVKIGNRVWMNYNLNVDNFRNGDTIPEAKTDEEWANAIKNNQPRAATVTCLIYNLKQKE